ncbi:unnamed protein product [Urochloa humidicola]
MTKHQRLPVPPAQPPPSQIAGGDGAVPLLYAAVAAPGRLHLWSKRRSRSATSQQGCQSAPPLLPPLLSNLRIPDFTPPWQAP